LPDSQCYKTKNKKERKRKGEGRRLTAPLPAPVLSFLNLAAIPDTCFPPTPLASSLDQTVASCPLDEEPPDIPEPEPGVPGVAVPALCTNVVVVLGAAVMLAVVVVAGAAVG
jgi:hypothetical protein